MLGLQEETMQLPLAGHQLLRRREQSTARKLPNLKPDLQVKARLDSALRQPQCLLSAQLPKPRPLLSPVLVLLLAIDLRPVMQL